MQEPVRPVLTLEPWKDLLPPDLHSYYKWACDSSETLNRFVFQVVVAWSENDLLSW